jgi:hypothetical protein
VQIAIDDFGTGYSSLSYLQQFPVDTLKIDKFFIEGVGREPERAALASAIIDLAKTLGLGTVVEGIEHALPWAAPAAECVARRSLAAAARERLLIVPLRKKGRVIGTLEAWREPVARLIVQTSPLMDHELAARTWPGTAGGLPGRGARPAATAAC